MKPISIPEIFLRRQRRRTHGSPLAWAAAAGLFAIAWVGAARLGWLRWNPLWAVAPAVLGLYWLIEWAKRVWQPDATALARECDARWELKGRMEAAVELAGSDSVVAIAQRLDTAQQLEPWKPVGTFRWLCGIAAALVGLGVVGIEFMAMMRSAQPATSASRPLADAAKESRAAGPAPAEPLRASIVWRSPPATIQAKPLDEIPLTAHAASNRGLQSISLEVAVNGTRTNSYPVDPGTQESLARPGEADLKLSLYLDETGAQPCDVVSYCLQAHAKGAPAFPRVVSPQQFVEVTDSAGEAGYSTADRKVLERLNALKQAELPLIARNFELIQTRQSETSHSWTDENVTLAAAQSGLAQTADEATSLAGRSGASASVAARLSQVARLMSEAGAAVASKANDAAAPLQAKSLAQLAEAERVFRQQLSAKAAAEPSIEVVTSREVKLPPRESTSAGRLEQLARRQTDSNLRLQQAAPESADQQAVAALQRSIAHDAAKLASEHRLMDAVQPSLGTALRAATDAANQLGLNDLPAAKEPAGEAKAALKKALETQESEGRKAADALLEQVRHELNAADQLQNPSAQRAQIEASRRQLATEAARQQEQGSAVAAQKLAQLAKQLGDSGKNRPAKSPAATAGNESAAPSATSSPQNKKPSPARKASSIGSSSSAASRNGTESESSGSGDDSSSAAGSSAGSANSSGSAGTSASGSGDSASSGAGSSPGGTSDSGGGAGGSSSSAASGGGAGSASSGSGGDSSSAAGSSAGPANSSGSAGTSGSGSSATASSGAGSSPGGGGTGSASSGSGGDSSSAGGSSAGPANSRGDAGTSASGSGDTASSTGGSSPAGASDSGGGAGGSSSSKADGSSGSTGGGSPQAQGGSQSAAKSGDSPAGVAASMAAETEAALSPDASLARTIRQLNAVGGGLSGHGMHYDPPFYLVALDSALQEAPYVSHDPEVLEIVRHLARARGSIRREAVSPAALQALAGMTRQLSLALERIRAGAQRDEWMRRFSPEVIDPDYRKQIEAYFERLSREGGER